MYSDSKLVAKTQQNLHRALWR